MKKNKIFILAAENSAEKYGEQIIKEFKKNKPEISFFGIGGDLMQQAGMRLLAHRKDLSVVGIFEVLSSLIKLKRIQNKIIQSIKEEKPKAVILIDYPDFNLILARKISPYKIPIYLYISPTIWAWRYNRIKTIKKYISKTFLIFPFEEKIYQKEKVAHKYVGHPLAYTINKKTKDNQFIEKWDIKKEETIVAILPGSRTSEVTRLMPTIINTVKIMKEKHNVKFFLLKADNINKDTILQYTKNQDINIIEQKEKSMLLSLSHMAISSCGTANLELAIANIPFIAIYKVNKLSYFLGKPFVKIKKYSIVNILSDKPFIKEFIQKELQAESVAEEAKEIIIIEKYRENMIEKLRETVSKIKTDNKKSEEIIYEEIMKDISTIIT